MEIDHQVAPFELAQRMNTLGFPQDTYFRWLGDPKSHWVAGPEDAGYGPDGGKASECAAPTVAEMGEWLPVELDSHHHLVISRRVTWFRNGHWVRSELAGCWSIHYQRESAEGGRDSLFPEGAPTEAEARARLLVALAESGALDPKSLSNHEASR